MQHWLRYWEPPIFEPRFEYTIEMKLGESWDIVDQVNDPWPLEEGWLDGLNVPLRFINNTTGIAEREFHPTNP